MSEKEVKECHSCVNIKEVARGASEEFHRTLDLLKGERSSVLVRPLIVDETECI